MSKYSSFHQKYIKPGLKRKRSQYEIVVPSSQPQSQKRKIYDIPDDSPAWTMPMPKYIAKGEIKGMDTLLTQTAIVSTVNDNGATNVLNLIQAGTGSWNRVGRKAHLKSARLKGEVKFTSGPVTSTGSINFPYLRMVVVWDKQPSGGAIPTFDTVFGITNQSGTESCTVLSPLKYDNMDRFSILRDEIIKPSSVVYPDTVANNTASYYVPFDMFIPLLNREVVFNGQSNPMTVSDISTGALYVYYRTSVAPNDADWDVDVTANSYCRLRYSD